MGKGRIRRGTGGAVGGAFGSCAWDGEEDKWEWDFDSCYDGECDCEGIMCGVRVCLGRGVLSFFVFSFLVVDLIELAC